MRELSIFAAAREAPSRDCLVASGRPWTFAEIAGRVASAIAALKGPGVTSGAVLGEYLFEDPHGTLTSGFIAGHSRRKDWPN